MKEQPISITAIGSISPLGKTSGETWASYLKDSHLFEQKDFGETKEWAAPLSKDSKEEIEQLRNSDNKYKSLDDSVLFALYASRDAIAKAGWKTGDDFGVNIGSSRGATALFEKYHQEFLENNRTATLSSPTTTLGNISSWVAHDLKTKGPEISHSITCSTALHAVLNGVAWLRSGMANKFLVGGSEAPLTPFTIAQMKALKIYSQYREENASEGNGGFPSRALDFEKEKSTMILGEGASVICLEKGLTEKTLAVIEGVGYATEPLRHNISISTDAECFQASMKMALGKIHPDEVDAIVMHAPGTVKGDISEYKAIEKVFCNNLPFLTTNKWKVGHTFGASGALSIELAVLMLQEQQLIKVPFVTNASAPGKLRKILVNAVGFGGNAVSILLSRKV
ncbi:beta-ketoacyl synthase N-terminal-like domain-containing protein [Zobellia galactanivorans]|uniref:beta-ketoacyl synthase N-terminal-like domain-containing protein n=1 Tax=Zobellia galactanivorans (strain DSM 12802 / CCUG 47099 / CIP 106680 / NCIMB 13871 / Dsij) TaxID=63186 RepID=UPI0026E39ADD|nr:beta-ketoacyl synthase N-terminal-like domain-containing protein [Zobellia galactanivorans]MDO6808370.1 beta-ketoacyl synthase N-terminal-like domain-containing protein [Zobellia galactanivorans]